MDTDTSLQPNRITYSVPEAVRATGMSRSALYLALKAGHLRARKQGKRTLIEDGELRRFISGLPTFGGDMPIA